MRVLAVAGVVPRLERSLRHALDILGATDVKELRLERPLSRLDRAGRRFERRFQHTPAPLIDAWRISRLLQRSSKPGDVVLISDHAGLGGVFALTQAAFEPSARRSVWTVAADSAFLEMRLVAGTAEGLPMPLDSQVDWEITQYRWSDRVLATCHRAVEELAGIGVQAELIGAPSAKPPDIRPIEMQRIWAPGPVSRRNQSGVVLRAATSLPPSSITVGEADEPDLVWSGTAWEATQHARAVLDSRVDRSDQPSSDPNVIVIGDPYSVPEETVATLHRQGVPVVVPEGSVAAVLWPHAPTWTDSDQLAALLTSGQIDRDEANVSTVSPAVRRAPQFEDRAVSVGVPIFRDVRFLPECVESILSQELEPIEVVLVDDGSGSEEVDQVLEELAGSDARIRVIRGEHRGVCVARNAALQEMTGDSFVFVDSDDLLLPTFLSSCASVLRTSPDIWAVATWTEFFGAYEGIEAKPPFDRRVGMRENPIVSTCALVDMRAREAGVRFAPDLAFLFCEDWHFWSQIVAAGGTFGLVPEPLARHRVHTSSGGFLRTDLAHAVGKSRAIEPLLR
jgi:Glycosyl transferase family 2